MTYEQLAHLIKVCCEHADVYEIVVFGSQSVLGAKPIPGSDFTASMEADVFVRGDPDRQILSTSISARARRSTRSTAITHKASALRQRPYRQAGKSGL